MISRIDHVSVAVGDIEKAVRFFSGIFGAKPGAGETDPDMKYAWRVFSIGDLSRFELLNPTGSGSFLDNFLKKNPSGGVHHITFETPDIRQAAASLERNGIPYFGFNDKAEGWKELFIHPKDAFGVLIQLAEFDPDDYLDSSVKLRPGEKWSVEKTQDGATLKLAHPGGGTVTIDMERSQIRAFVRDLEKIVEDR